MGLISVIKGHPVIADIFLAICNMLEIETLRELLFEKGIITKDEFIAKFKKLDREMKEKGAR